MTSTAPIPTEQDFQERLRAIVAPAVAEEGHVLWDLRFSGRPGRSGTLTVFVDREVGGVALDDCVRISRKLGIVLDVEDPFSGPYSLEVSSPGLDRELTRPEHYRRCLGQIAKVKLLHHEEGRRTLRGTLASADQEGIEIDADEGRIAIPHDRIVHARIVPAAPAVAGGRSGQSRRSRSTRKRPGRKR